MPVVVESLADGLELLQSLWVAVEDAILACTNPQATIAVVQHALHVADVALLLVDNILWPLRDGVGGEVAYAQQAVNVGNNLMPVGVNDKERAVVAQPDDARAVAVHLMSAPVVWQVISLLWWQLIALEACTVEDVDGGSGGNRYAPVGRLLHLTDAALRQTVAHVDSLKVRLSLHQRGEGQ